MGKSRVAASLLAAARAQGLQTAAMKPVASGCEEIDGCLRNADALLLQRYCSLPLSYEQINPVALRAAIAPHLAAAQEGRTLSVSRLEGLARAVLMEGADFTVLEGAGGWRVPLNAREMLSQLPAQLELPVVLVVGIRLGCINHALLTEEAITGDGVTLAGWVANHLAPPSPSALANVDTLKALINSPCLGELLWAPDQQAQDSARYLDIGHLVPR